MNRGSNSLFKANPFLSTESHRLRFTLISSSGACIVFRLYVPLTKYLGLSSNVTYVTCFKLGVQDRYGWHSSLKTDKKALLFKMSFLSKEGLRIQFMKKKSNNQIEA